LIWLKLNWKNILIVAMAATIIFFAGRGFENWSSMRMAVEIQRQNVVLAKTEELLKQVKWASTNDVKVWRALGYDVPLPALAMPDRPDSSEANNGKR